MCINYGHQMKAWIKEIRMFGVNLANKYSSTITKNLGLGYNSRLCSAGPFLIMHPYSVCTSMTRLGNLVRHLLSAKRQYDFPRSLTPLCSCSDFPLPLQTLFTSNRPLDMAKIPLSSQLHALTSGNIFWSAMYYMQVPWLLETVSWFQDYWAVNSGFRCYCHCEMQLLFLCFSYILWQVLSNHGQAVVEFLNGHAHFFSTYACLFNADSTDATTHTKIHCMDLVIFDQNGYNVSIILSVTWLCIVCCQKQFSRLILVSLV